MGRANDLEQLREAMGTLPKRTLEEHTEFIRGGEAVNVELVEPDPPTNFYRGMFVMATSTWGGPYDSGLDKWEQASPEARARVVLAVLQRKALPLALEHPTFLFEISGCSRSAFDQIARARIGATFASMGMRDNAHPDIPVIVPPKIFDDQAAFAEFKLAVLMSKKSYVALLKQGQKSWQDARAVLPMGMMHRFCFAVNYAALANFCSRRLMFCEQYDTVAVAWMLKKELGKHYALLAEALRPTCDFAKKCTYHEANSLGEAFGCLFRGCGRWPDPYEYYEFNEAAADVQDIQRWVEERIPEGPESIDWEGALALDKHFFEED